MTVSPGDRVRRILSDGLRPAADVRLRGPVLREVTAADGTSPKRGQGDGVTTDAVGPCEARPGEVMPQDVSPAAVLPTAAAPPDVEHHDVALDVAPAEPLASDQGLGSPLPFDTTPAARPRVPDDLRERLTLLDRLSSRSADRARPPSNPRVPARGAAAGPDRAEAGAATVDGTPRLSLAPPAAARPPAGAVAPAGAADIASAAKGPLTLERLLGGEARRTLRGTCWQVDHIVPLDLLHGRASLRAGARARLPLRMPERAPAGPPALDAREAVFLDTETTGLSGGTGTVAFLVGLGWIEGDVFRVRQLLMRDYPEEAAMLAAVREDVGNRPLVTFNGRSYDWPLLVTRWRLNRSAWGEVPGGPHDPGPRAHLDLLMAARRLWARTLHSRSLSSLERHVLGVDRGEDLAGARIPAAWFHYLRTGWSFDMARACRHNVLDVVTLLALLGRVDETFQRPEGPAAHPGDALGTARWLIELEAFDRAERCLRAGLAEATGPERFDLHRDLGTLLRRTGRPEAALAEWQSVARELPRFDRHAYEQVAKLLEHALGRPAEALTWTTEALGRLTTDGASRQALEHRADRLRRKA